MKLSASDVLPIAEATGFKAEMLEKVLHLMNLLNVMTTHPFLKGRWTLKGGTALNLFFNTIPRLSVDIDINYIGALDRQVMLEERPRLETALQAIFLREGFNIKRIPDEHAGGKWHLSYQSFTGQSGNLEVDLNYMFRQPLWDITILHSQPLGNFQATNIPVLDIHELAAGKLAALFARKQARDLFDSHWILQINNIDKNELRIGFVVYGAMNREDWRKVSIEKLVFDSTELAQQLLPTLQSKSIPINTNPQEYGTYLLNSCRKRLTGVLPFNDKERKFLDQLLDHGEIDASLLTHDKNLQQRILNQPLLAWKAQNVKQYYNKLK